MSPLKTVIGLDLSLTATGLAVIDGYNGSGTGSTQVVSAERGQTGHRRLAYLSGYILGVAEGYEEIPLVVVEGPSFGSTAGQRGHHERAGLWWLVTQQLWQARIPTAVVPPASLKRFATGKGNANKDQVLLATARRFPYFVGGNDEADALWLAAMGADHLGHPIVAMPEAHRAALAGVTWPTTDTPAGPGEGA